MLISDVFNYLQDGYGKKDPNRRLEETEAEKIDLSKFDESDPRQHQMKIAFGCGIKFGFRGISEHTFLEISNITHGEFPSHHPFSGYEYYGIDNIQDKQCRLSVNQDHVRDTKDHMRIPVMDNDLCSEDFGGSIKRYLNKLAPGQTRFYCKVIPDNLRQVDLSDGTTQVFYGNCPIGKEYIKKLFKDGAAILGLSNPQNFGAHSLRAYFVTKLSNGNGVGDEERMVSSRHTSVGASAIYQERNTESESNKFVALGIELPKKKKVLPILNYTYLFLRPVLTCSFFKI